MWPTHVHAHPKSCLVEETIAGEENPEQTEVVHISNTPHFYLAVN